MKLMLKGKHKWVSASFLLLTLLYIGFSTLPAPNPETASRYHVSADQLRVLVLTILVPYVIIWLVALRSYLRLKNYGDLIADSADGAAMQRVATGIGVLSFWLPVSSLVSSVFSFIYLKHPAATPSLTIINNYLNVVLLLAAFLILEQGTQKLMHTARSLSWRPNQFLSMLYLAFASLYTWLVLTDPVRRLPDKTTHVATYYEPDWLMVLTILIPRLITWFIGLQVVQMLYTYRRKVRGVIYKRAFRQLSIGLAGVVVSIIALRCTQSLTIQLERLSLGVLLLIIYLLLILIGVGYGLIARGSKHLQKIEQV